MFNTKFVWGLILAIVGGLMIAANFGYLPANFWNELWKFWPVILILLGISSLSGRKEHRTGNQIGLVISLVIILLVAAVVVWGSKNYNNINTKTTSISEEVSKDNVDLNIKFGAAELNMQSADTGRLSGAAESYSDIQVSKVDQGSSTKISVDQNTNNPGHWIGRGVKNQIDLSLPKSPVYKIGLDTGASKFNLDLSEIKLEELEINGGACSGDIKLSNSVAYSKVTISSGASSFKIKIPKDAALKVVNDSGLSSFDHDGIALDKNGKEYKTSNFDQAANKIDMHLSTGASSINIDEY